MKTELMVLEKLGRIIDTLSIGELVDFYGLGHTEFQLHWKDFLADRTESMDLSERDLYVDIAYDVYDSIVAVSMKKPDWDPQVIIEPRVDFRKDLGFYAVDFDILQGAFKDEYIPGGVDEFHKLKTTADTVDYVLENRLLC